MTMGDVIAGVALLLTGGLGWKTITDFFFRPKLYKAHRSQNLVTLAEPKRREHVEALLKQQGEPTALAEIEWWNSGRKASGTTTVSVTVPGSVVAEYEVGENAEAKTTPPMQVTPHGLDRIDAIKTSLNPSARCRLVVGYVPEKPELVDKVTVLIHEAGRAVPNAQPPGTVSGWITFPMLAICILVPGIASRMVQSAGKPWPELVWSGGLIGLLVITVLISRRLAYGPRVGPSWAKPRKTS